MGNNIEPCCSRVTSKLTIAAVLAFFTLGIAVGASAQSISYDLYGYRANEGGGGAISTPWTKGNLGNLWAEGEWVAYQLVVENGDPAGAAFAETDSFVISFDFTRFGGGGAYFRFVDLVRSIQVGTVPRNDNQGWPQSDGSAYPDGTREQIEIAQNNPGEYYWTGFTPLYLPNNQVNVTLTGGLDTPPGEDKHIIKIYKTDLPLALQTANRLVFYWQLHESRTFVWANGLQDQYDQSPTDDWGGWLYSTDGWPADSSPGSGYVPGASGHCHLEIISGNKDVPIPIPEQLPGSVDGLKFLDADGDSTYNMGDSPLEGWRIYVSGMVENIMFETSTLTDPSGLYSFPFLTSGTWTLSEADQREVPTETGYMQTYTNLYSPDVGVGSATPIAEVGKGPWGWEVMLTLIDDSQGDMNFGNKLCEIVCTDPPDITIDCTESTDPSNTGWPTVEYNCGPVDTSYSDDVSGTCPTVITRTWTFTDYVGNTSICDQIITVQDTTAPVITCPPDTTFDCVMGDPGEATATDNCDSAPDITHFDNVVSARCPYVVERTWVATDSCGNADSCVQTITVQDTTAPVISCPPDTTFECDNVGDFGSATATDNCDPNPVINEISRDSTAGCGITYTLVIGYEAVDSCGNADTCYQTVTVVDTTPPQITCPPDTTFECDNVGDFGSATATDNCDTDVDINEISRDSTANCGDTYTLVIGYEAVDDCGNADTCYQLVTVVDTTPPSITCPPNAVFDCVMGNPGLPTVWDNCDPNPDYDYEDVVTSESCPRVIERTWTVTDDCGNSDYCVQTITVQDTIPPVITCAPDEVIACDDTVQWTEPTATDNCDPNPTITMVYTDIPDGPGVYKRGWIAIDECNNETDTCYQTITVEPCPCTFTIGGWGSTCPDSPGPGQPEDQPGCIRDNYWDVVFGTDSVMIGHPDGFTAKWSSSLAVENFLPSGTTPGVLDQNYVDPLTTSAGVLASQILALRLNAEYSCAGVFTILGFPSAGDCYGDALVPESCANGLFDGLTVYEFLALADSVVAGINTDYTPSQVNFTATCLNQFESDCDPYAPTTSAIESNNTSGSARPSTDGEIPTVFSLGQNYPNPFNPVTEFEFGIPTASHVTLNIFNIMGQKVTTLVNGYYEPGMYNVIWNGSDASSGVYFYRIEAGDYIETRKMLLLK